MKLGTENRKKVIAAVVLLPLALYLAVRTFSTASPTATAPAAANGTAAQRPAAARRNVRPSRTAQIALAPTLDPRLRLDILQAVEAAEYKGVGRNIFSPRSEEPRPEPQKRAAAPPVVAPPVVDPGPPQPPPPPPINLRFYGFASRPGEAKRIFLSNGEDIFVGGEGDVVNRRYKILRISNNAVEIEDVLSNSRQTIPLTQG